MLTFIEAANLTTWIRVHAANKVLPVLVEISNQRRLCQAQAFLLSSSSRKRPGVAEAGSALHHGRECPLLNTGGWGRQHGRGRDKCDGWNRHALFQFLLPGFPWGREREDCLSDGGRLALRKWQILKHCILLRRSKCKPPRLRVQDATTI